jgi:hypothetical protein
MFTLTGGASRPVRKPNNIYRFRRLKWKPPGLLPSLRRAAGERRERRIVGLLAAALPLAIVAGAVAAMLLGR